MSFASVQNPIRKNPGPIGLFTQRTDPYRLFFPAAMLHACLFLPLALLAMTTGSPAGLATGPSHGGEMLAGYVLAVIAGFLLPRLTRWRLLLLFALWLCGRIAIVAGLPGLWSALPSVGFAVAIASLIVPRFIGVAKKLRNQATGPLVGLIATVVSVAIVLLATGITGGSRPVLYLAVILLAALLLFMGGRIIVPTAAGAFQRQGQRLTTRVQPRLEGAMLLCFIAAIIGYLAEPLYLLGAAGVISAGAIAFIRLARWRLWQCRQRPDLWGLGIGYAWVCIGLVLLGTSSLSGWPTPVAGLHAITVGGLGTLSLNVMGRTWLLRAKADPARARFLVIGSVLISLAAASRIAAILLPSFKLNWLAGIVWSLAFSIALIGLLTYRRSN